MHESESRTPISFYLVVGAGLFVVLGTLSVFLYFNWGKLGLPQPGKFAQEVQEAHTGEVTGAVVVEGNAANYLKYVNREDVFVVVNYYLRQDQLNDDVKLDLKRLSARHEGKVVLMNVDSQRHSQLAATAMAPRPPDVRLMHAGEQIGQFRGEKLVWELEELVNRRKGDLADPLQQAATETDPYAESLRKGVEQFVPEGISTQ